MIDAITYTNNLPGLKSWLSSNKNIYKEISFDSSGVWMNIAKVPTKVNGSQSVSLVRVDSLDFLNAAPLEILASGPEGMDIYELLDQPSTDKIEAVLNRQIHEIREDGELIGYYTEPFKFGVIA